MELTQLVRDSLQKNILLKRTLAIFNQGQDSTFYTYLKPAQSRAIRSCVEYDHDLLGILATGSGKTLIFILIPIYSKLYIQYEQKTCSTGSVTIVISPLNSIISQQKDILGKESATVINESKMHSFELS